MSDVYCADEHEEACPVSDTTVVGECRYCTAILRERERIRVGVEALPTYIRTWRHEDVFGAEPSVDLLHVLSAIEGRLVNEAPTKAPTGCANCGHSRARHYLKGDRCANASCGCIYPSRAVVSEGAETPLPPMPSEVLGPVDIRDYLGMPPVQGHFTGGLITDKNRAGSRFVPRGEATP